MSYIIGVGFVVVAFAVAELWFQIRFDEKYKRLDRTLETLARMRSEERLDYRVNRIETRIGASYPEATAKTLTQTIQAVDALLDHLGLKTVQVQEHIAVYTKDSREDK